jgi:hypothetical protein
MTSPAGLKPPISYRTPLWLVWHKVNLRPLVGIFRTTLLEQASSVATTA